jgi:hypothetical protein
MPSTTWTESNLFSLTEVAALTALARTIYPHQGLADAPYERVAEKIAHQSATDPALWHLIHDGLADVARDLHRPIPELSETALRAVLQDQVETAFFDTLRALVAWYLYDDREVWQFVGYPGASFEKGGYLTRGFNDLSWLPEPRVDETGVPFEEVIDRETPNDASRTLRA